MKTNPSQSNTPPEQGNDSNSDRLILTDERQSTSTDQKREQNLLGEDRLLVLSDGVFAIAITLLVINIRLPSDIPNEAQFNEALGTVLGQALIYIITFVVIAAYWSQHRRVVRQIERTDSLFTWLTFLFLAFVAFFPATSGILGDYTYPGAVILYTLAFAGCGFSLIILWLYAAWGNRLLGTPLPRKEVIGRAVNLAATPVYFTLSLILLLTPLPTRYVFWSWVLLPFFYRLVRLGYRKWRTTQ